MHKKLYVLLVITVFSLGPLYAQTLVSSVFLESYTTAELNPQLQPFGITAKYNVDVYKLLYASTGSDGMPDTLSGLIAIPQLNGEDLPVVCYQHGTTDGRSDVPSNLQSGSDEAIFWASQGYVCSAADYHGLGESRGFHPYVHAATQARAGIDMLRACKDYAQDNNISLSDHLFLTGYSQGGHAAMAMHEELETNLSNEFSVTAAAHMSGPYSLSGEMRERVLSDLPYFFAGYIPYLMIGYNQVYGDLFVELEEVFKPRYANILRQFEDPDYSLFSINQELIVALFLDFASSVPKRMLQDSVLIELETNPNHWTNQILAENDNYNWVPESPTRMYYCQSDEQVVYTNAIVADSFMNANDANDVAALSMGANLNHSGCVVPAFSAGLTFFNSFLTTSSTADTKMAAGFQVYPNPAADFVRIRMADGQYISSDMTVRLIDTRGRQVASKAFEGFADADVPVADLPDGLYFLEVNTEVGLFTKKIMVQH